MGPKLQWEQHRVILSSCAYSIKVLLLLLWWYILAKQPGSSVHLLLKHGLILKIYILKNVVEWENLLQSHRTSCASVALAELPRVGRQLLWPSPSWILWQREARGGGHLCVALQVRDQSHGIPWKKKSECVTPVMSPKLLSIKQAEMGIQGQQRAVPEDYLPNMVVWLLPADEFPL